MIKRLLLILCFLLSATSLMATGSVSGIVTNTVSDPLFGATVTILRGSDTVVATATTDGDGFYSSSGIPKGEYVVVASLSSFQTAIVGVTVLNGEDSVAGFALEVNPGAISGQVVDNGTHLAIVGATVHAIANNTLIGSATTDGSGNYTIDGLAAGSYVVTAAASTYQASKVGAIVLSSDTTTVDFSLVNNPGTILGTVTSAGDAMPISDALIQVSIGGTIIYSALTDGAGNYTITGVAAGSYIVTAAALTYDTTAVGATVTAGGTTTVDFSLDSSLAFIIGTITDEDTDLPISGALVEVKLASIVVGSAVTDNDGNYVIFDVAPGPYVVNAYARGYETATVGAVVFFEDTTIVDVYLESSPGAIAGSVTTLIGDVPIAGALVQLISDDIVIDSTLTDSLGNYRIRGITSGSYFISAAAVTYEAQVTGAIVDAYETTTVDFFLEASPGSISGTVTSFIGGVPISGAVIEVRLGNIVLFSTLTDSSGAYSVSGIAPGSYIVHASATDYRTSMTGALVTSSATTTVDFSLHSCSGTILGTVIDEDTDFPIEGALVEVKLASIVVGSAVTDSDGDYLILGIAPGSYIVSAYATDYETATTGAIVVCGDTTTVDFSLGSSPGDISGTVTSSVGDTPIAGVLVQLLSDGTVIGTTLTDSFGDYEITGVAPGSYAISATETTSEGQVTGVVVTADETTTVDFSLGTSPGSVGGTVTSAVGSLPIPGGLVAVSVGNTVLFSTVTDNSGAYDISGVAAGSYLVQASATDYQTTTAGAIVVASSTTTVDFSSPSSPGTISGTATNDDTGLPISGGLVEVSVANTVVGSAVTDSNGNYSISGIPPGSYVVNIYATNYQTTSAGAIVVTDGTTTVDFSLQSNPGTITGTVTSATGGGAISGALVQMFYQGIAIDSTFTNSSGRYTITGLVPNSYSVAASAGTYGTAIAGANVFADQTTTLNFSLVASPGSISGTVVSTVGSVPIQGAVVQVNLSNVPLFSTSTNSAGNYSISGAAPGTYAAIAHASTFQTAVNTSVVVTSNTTTPANFSLQSNPGTVQGVVTDSVTGLPLAGVFINIFDNGVFINVAVTDSSGNYSVTGLATGTYTLTSTTANYDTSSVSFSATAGDTTSLNVTLSPNFPPRNLTGSVIVNAFLFQADRIHHLQWSQALGGNIATYRIYRNGAFLATVSPNGPLQYDDHNRSPKVRDSYTVTAVNTSGNESSAVFIALQ